MCTLRPCSSGAGGVPKSGVTTEVSTGGSTLHRAHHRPVATTIVVLAALLATLAVSAGPAGAETRDSTRMAGPDRYATAVAVSRASWPSGSDAAFLVAAGEFADALSVGAAAAAHGPVLLTDTDRLPQATIDELRRLQPGALVVVGGHRAVSDAVLQSAARYARATVRVSGSDRYATSVEVARTFVESSSTVYIANGGSYETAIVASTAAGKAGAPLVLVTPTALPPVVERYLAETAPERVVVVGDAATVSDAVLNRIDTYAGTVERVAGRDHAGTAAAVSRADHVLSSRVLIATQATFPDALTGGAYASRLDAPLLFVQPDRVPLATACEVGRLGATDIAVLGGNKAVSDRVVQQLRDGSALTDPAACDRAFVPMAGAPLHDGVYSPDGTRLYVVNQQANQVEVLDVASGAHIRSIWVGSDPLDIDVTKDGRYLYVTHSGSHDVLVVDVASGAWVGPRIRLPIPATAGDTTRAFTLAIDARDRVLFTNSEFSAEDGGPLWSITHATWLARHRDWKTRPNDEAYIEPTEIGTAFTPPDGATATRLVRSADRSVVGLIVTGYGAEATVDTSECDSLPSQDSLPEGSTVRSKEQCVEEKYAEAEAQGDQGLLIWHAQLQRFGAYARQWGEPVTNVAFDPGGDWAVVHGDAETTFLVNVEDVFGERLALRGTVTSQPGAEGIALGRDGRGCLVAWRLVDGEAERAALELLQLHQYDANVGRCRDRFTPARGADGQPFVVTLDDAMAPDSPRLNEVDLTRAQLILGPGGASMAAMTATGVQLLAPPLP